MVLISKITRSRRRIFSYLARQVIEGRRLRRLYQPIKEISGIICWLSIAIGGHQKEDEPFLGQLFFSTVVLEIDHIKRGVGSKLAFQLRLQRFCKFLGSPSLRAKENAAMLFWHFRRARLVRL